MKCLKKSIINAFDIINILKSRDCTNIVSVKKINEIYIWTHMDMDKPEFIFTKY